MSPISKERVQFIEERLFILARTVQTLRREGMRQSVRHFTDSGPEAHAIFMKTMQDLNSERLALMMERAAIEEYFQERHQEGNDGS